MAKQCKKVSYLTEKYANEDIKKFNLTNRKIKPTRAYLCLNCNTWHLTSSPINSNVVKRYYKNILSLKAKINLLEKDNANLKKSIVKTSNNKAQIDLRKLQNEFDKYKIRFNDYKNKYIKKCEEFNEFKVEVSILIKRLEESEVNNG
jgi:hypothetical protein